jgi:hypothetical protein
MYCGGRHFSPPRSRFYLFSPKKALSQQTNNELVSARVSVLSIQPTEKVSSIHTIFGLVAADLGILHLTAKVRFYLFKRKEPITRNCIKKVEFD